MIAVYIDGDLKQFENEIKYAVEFVFHTLGFEHKYIKKLEEIQNNDILIYYGLIEPTAKEAYILAMDKIFFFIPCDIDLFKPGSISRQKLDQMIREISLDQKIPLLCKQEFTDPIKYFINENLYYGSIKFDLFGNVFFNLIDYQKFAPGREEKEYEIPDSELVFKDYLLVPYMNYYLWILEQTILEAINSKSNYFLIKKELWPNAEEAAVAISHSIPKLRKWNFKRILKSISEDFLIFYKFHYVLKNFASRLKYIATNVEEYWNFDILHKLEDKYEIISTYFWGAETTKKGEFEYDIGSTNIYKEISRQIDKGHEIALLATSNSYCNDIFQHQKKQIVQISLREKVGVRINGFKSDPYHTNELLMKNNFAFDSSRKYHSFTGFVNGLSFPFHLMNSYQSEVVKSSFSKNNNLEIPLICSDESFILSKSNHIPYDNIMEIITKMWQSIKLVNGLITFDFSIHNFAELEYLEKLVENVYKDINKKNIYQNTYLNISQWWKKRERVEVTEKRSSVELYFPESLERFSFSIKGNKKLSHVDYTKCSIHKDIITLSQLEPDTTVKVFLDKIETEPKQ